MPHVSWRSARRILASCAIVAGAATWSSGQTASPPGLRRPDLSLYQQNRQLLRTACLQTSLIAGFTVDDPVVFETRSREVALFAQSVARDIAQIFADCTQPAPALQAITVFGLSNGVTYRRYETQRANGWDPGQGERIDVPSASQELAEPTLAFAPRGTDQGPLARRGFFGATLIYEDGRRATYLSRLKDGGRPLLVAVHKTRPTDPLLSLRFAAPMVLGFSLADDEAAYLNANVMGRLPASERTASIAVAHFADGFYLPYAYRLPDMTRIEQPLATTTFVVSEDGRYRGQGRMAFAKGSPNTSPADALRNTPADIYDYLSELDERGRAVHASALSGYTEPDRAIFSVPAGRVAYLTEQARARDEAVRAGYVYKNPAFWLQAPGPELEAIFSGSRILSAESFAVRFAVLRYVYERSNRCPSLFTARDAVYNISVTTTIVDGSFVHSSTDVVGQVKVERRFSDAFHHYFDVAEGRGGRIDNSFPSTPTPQPALIERWQRRVIEGAVAQARISESINREMAWLFETKGCDNAVVAQVAENLYRYSYGLPTAQEAVVAIPKAAAETDDVLVFGRATTLRQGCLEDRDTPFAGSRNIEFCTCMDDRLRPVLKPFEYAMYSRDFSLVRKLAGTLADPDGGDARLQAGVAACQR